MTAAGNQFPVASNQFPVTSFQFYWLLATGYWQLATGNWLLARSDVAAACAHVVRGIAHLDTDGVPAAVLGSRCRVPEVVLLAQFGGGAGGRGIQVACRADDLGAPAAVIGNVAQGGDVDAVVRHAAPARGSAPRSRIARCGHRRWRRRGRWTPAWDRKRQRNRPRHPAPLSEGRHVATPRERVPPRRSRGRAVDADRVDQHFALANQLLDREDVGAAARVVAVRDDQDGLLLVVPLLRHRDRVGDGIIERGAPGGANAIERLAEAPLVAGPPFDQPRGVVEAVEEHFVFGIEQLDEKTIERLARREHLVAVHAAARIEDDAEADRDAFGAEVRHRLRLFVVEHAEVVLREPRHEAPGLVAHGRIHVDQLDAGAELERLRIRLGRLLLLRILRGKNHTTADQQRAGDQSKTSTHRLTSSLALRQVQGPVLSQVEGPQSALAAACRRAR